MEKAALRKVAQQEKERKEGGKKKPCFQICQAHLQNSNWGCPRQFEGEEGAEDKERKGHMKESHQTVFLRPTDGLGFHIDL